MNQENQIKPKNVNHEFYEEETFPEIIGFCDRDDTTHAASQEEESYEYKLNTTLIFKVIKRAKEWQINEYWNGKKTPRELWSELKNGFISCSSFRQ